MTTNQSNIKFSSEVVPTFDRTLFGSVHRPVDPMKWDIVLDFYEKKLYKDVLIGILDYIDSDMVNKRGNAAKTDFVIPHGSIIVHLKIDDKNFNVIAPFLEVPSAQAVPLLRKVAEINLYPLNLSSIVLEDTRLVFKYNCPLELCEPYKIYEVLKEICLFADGYDDEFIKKFNARWIHRPVIKKFPTKYTDFAWDRVRLYIDETFAYMDFVEKKRLLEYCWDFLVITLMKIDYYVAPQGVLRTDIEQMVSQLQNKDTPLPDRIRTGREFMNSLKNLTKEEFIKDLYAAEVFIPVRVDFTHEMIESYFQGGVEQAKKEMANREYVSAVLTLQNGFLNLFYNYSTPADIQEIITAALVQSSRKTWDKAAFILLAALEKLLQQKPTKTKGGFWRTLFVGNK